MAHTPGTPLAPGGRRRGDGSLRGVPGGRLPGSAPRGDPGGRPPGAARHRGNGTGQARVLLDDISKEIIEQLQQDGRRSYAAIGKAVGLSEAAVRQRVQRLIDGGAMQIVAVTDPMTLGFRRQTMIGVRCSGDLERVADQLAAMDEIDYVVIIAGSFDLLIEVVCEDDDQLLEILTRVRSIPSVTATETFVYLKLRKQTYSWGTR
jgi:Lrp/AsnC family transcriptional regulator for asnA, asnC and gidA